MTGLLDAEQMRATDRYAIDELGILGSTLMERAAEALSSEVLAHWSGGRVLVYVGKGNNGGDGLAAVRLLRERDVESFAVLAFPDGTWTGDAALMRKKLADEAVIPLGSEPTDGVSCAVDCLLGTGSAGAPRGPVLDAVIRLNELKSQGVHVVACDVPTGVDASTGEVLGDVVHASSTVTFHAMKPGLWIRPGKGLVGEVTVADIGLLKAPGTEFRIGLIDDTVVNGLSSREVSGDKFSAGAVVIVGGSSGLTGAPMLCGLGAARAGAGYVTAVLPESLISASDQIPEVMGLGVAQDPDTGGHSPNSSELIIGKLGPDRSLVVGPGIGRTDGAYGLVAKLLVHATAPTVVDADGLRAVADLGLDLSDIPAPLVLTPHSGEMAALLGITREEVDAQRLKSVLTLAGRTQAVVVLKGDDTLVADPHGVVGISRGGAPGLATAGSGDVLGGVIGALLARGADSFEAACAGVRIHVEAGRLAAMAGAEGILASDIASSIPQARASLGADQRR